MKNNLKYITAIILFALTMPVSAQVTIEKSPKEISEKDKVSKSTEKSFKEFDYKVSEIAVEIQNITVKEKQNLRVKVDSINNLVDQNAISEDAASAYKNKYAKDASETIEAKVAKLQDSLTNMIQNRVDFAMKNGEYLTMADTTKLTNIQIGKNLGPKKDKDGNHLGERRNSFRLYIAYGITNLATDGAFANSDIRYLPSNHIQAGFLVKTRVLKNSNLLYLRYGIGWEYNSLKPTEHRYFEVVDGQTVLSDYDDRFTKSRLAANSFQIPVYLEFDFGKKRTDAKTGRNYFISESTWRMGIGGYVNFADSRGKQIYHYRDDEAKYRVEKYSNLGIEKTRYGVGTYIGYASFALQFQYELTPLFKNNDVKQNVWSLGLRIDL